MTTAEMRRDAAQLRAHLQNRGRRVTSQRLLILETVRSTDRHPTAEWVYRRVRRRLPRVSLGTVYRNLRVLAEEGLLQELEAGGLGRYDGNLARHDHFRCTACGRIVDVPAPAGRRLGARAAALAGFEISHHRVEFYGRCAACRARTRRRAAARRAR